MFSLARINGSKLCSAVASNNGSAALLQRFFSGDAKDQKIGVIGIGQVGKCLVDNLQKSGYKVTAINDLDTKRCNDYKGKIEIKNTPREVVESVDVIITALPKPPHVKACFEGPDGLLAGFKKDQLWIDHSTTDYGQTVEFEKQVNAKGAHMLESPITGGMDALKLGQMGTWVAGDKAMFEKAKPIMDANYTMVMYTGGMGTAMLPKVMSNMLCCIGVCAMTEMLMIAKRSGLDLTTFWHAIRASVGTSFVWETAAPNVFRGDYHPEFSLDLQCKDINLFYQMARDSKTPIEFSGHMQQIYNRALYKYGPEKGCYIIPKLLEDELNERLEAPGFEKWTYEIEDVDGNMVVRHKNIDLSRVAPKGQKVELKDKE